MFQKMEIYVTIISAIIIGVISFFHNISLIEVVTRFLIVISVSYIFALLLKLYINKFIIKDEDVKEQLGENNLKTDEEASENAINEFLDYDNDNLNNEMDKHEDIKIEDKYDN